MNGTTTKHRRSLRHWAVPQVPSVKHEPQTFTFTVHELTLVTGGLEREATALRDEYRSSHQLGADTVALDRILADKQEVLDLAARLEGVEPAAVTLSREHVAEMRADLEENYGFDMLGETDAEVIEMWTNHAQSPNLGVDVK
jgi:hypothetical protein